MDNFWNCCWGFLMFISGILLLVNTAKARRKSGFKDKYGNDIGIYGAAMGFITIGLILFLKNMIAILSR
jgi:hypothetical protein